MTNFIEEFYYGNLDPQARSTGNEDIVLCGVLLKFNDYKALLNMLFYRLNRMEFGRVAFSNANYPLVCPEY